MIDESRRLDRLMRSGKPLAAACALLFLGCQGSSAGSPGARGPAGPTGATGTQGAVGSQGPIGPTGGTGPMGLDGPQGPQGIQGPRGDIGPQGFAGTTGAQGIQGSAGAMGPSGPVGQAGPTGPKGAKGDQGITGPTGPSGTFSGTFAGDVTIDGSVSISGFLSTSGDVLSRPLEWRIEWRAIHALVTGACRAVTSAGQNSVVWTAPVTPTDGTARKTCADTCPANGLSCFGEIETYAVEDHADSPRRVGQTIVRVCSAAPQAPSEVDIASTDQIATVAYCCCG
jgi:hypothetical protein